MPFLTKSHWFSRLYGCMQKMKTSKKKIPAFIEKFQADTSEYLEPVSSFSSFNDFFIRKLKKEARPIAEGEKVASLPADGRYLVFPDTSKGDHFYIKGQRLNIDLLLQDKALANEYKDASVVFARLCPTDYHRFHFPCDCVPSEPRLINGYLHSVNPMALRKNISILSENKRVVTELETKEFGKVLYIEVGAVAVGSIKQTFTPGKSYSKGDEKGYFEFGGSSVLLLFKQGTITFEEDLISASSEKLEIKANMGECLGKAT
ncbi:phosphatidylserine decarboxylase [Candidatus Aerophobetes bacterium]|uniref:phosphatidylserine decarboxylase n=1 Tax=Aerophobetes bacterium TaxID=2030807 RepID=A0A2A4YKC2_UNCAE|nr:MAG: phosphatidylserine decarboxylase [Candidatus Aerophobetes bacterium]